MAKQKVQSPLEAKSSKQHRQVTSGSRGVARPLAAKANKGQTVRGARQSDGRQGKAAADHPQQKLQAGRGRGNRDSSVSQDVSIDAQPSYATTGGTQLGTDQAQSQPATLPDGASAQSQQPAIETMNQHPALKGGPSSADGQLTESKGAARNDTSLPTNNTVPAVKGLSASHVSVPAPLAGPQLHPVLKHATRVSQLGRAAKAVQPVACFSASAAAVHSHGPPGTKAETHCPDNAAAAVAAKHSSDAQKHSANASRRPAKITKPQKAASAKRQQQQQQAKVSVAREHSDCQQLKLLPEDLPLHCECMARMQLNSAEPSQARYMQRARLADDSAQAIAENSAITGAVHAGCVPARPYALLDGAGDCNSLSPEEATELQRAREESDKFDFCLRKLLWVRALHQLGHQLADSALADRDNFVQVCLLGQSPGAQAGVTGPPSVQQAAQACKRYHAMLLRVYGNNLVLDPHVLDVSALKDYTTDDDLHHFRLLQRRFIVYRSSKAASTSHGSTAESPHPSMRSAHSQLAADSLQAGEDAPATTPDSAAAEESARGGQAGSGADAATSSAYVDIVGFETSPDADMPEQLPDWDDTLLALWQDLQKKTAQLTCKEVQDNSEVATAPSCTITEGSWRSGVCQGHNLADTDGVWAAIDDSLQNKAGSSQRLYFLDGTFPGDLPEGCSTHEDVPGLCCGVDQAVNRMLPAAMRSSRPTNFFKHLCVESTGTASFTMFAPIGQVTNVTAFHQETKKRRSWNCGSGDFIVQPVASANNVRKLERVHAAVMGAHRRSQCLLPLEMYLEEGIPLVCYVRDGPYAEMVELPEQSCHAFLSFSNAAAKPPSLKVSCNDWHLESELSSAYLLEKLVYSMQDAQVEAGPPEDGADSWVATPYATLQPCTIGGPDDARLKGTWQRPWADEMEVPQ